MHLFNRIIPYFSALLVAIAFEIWGIRPQWIYIISAVIIFIVVLSLWSLAGLRSYRNILWNFMSTPLFLLAGAIIFYLMIDDLIVRQVYIAGIAIIYMLILKNVFSFLHQTENYQPYALENIYSYVNLISLFLWYASFYGLSILLAWPFWFFTILIFFLSTFLFMRTLWSYKIPWQSSKLMILIVGLVLVEASYIISFLPTSYSFNALLLIVVYYILMNMIKDYLKDTITSSNIKKYLIISSAVVLVAAITTKWI